MPMVTEKAAWFKGTGGNVLAVSQLLATVGLTF